MGQRSEARPVKQSGFPNKVREFSRLDVDHESIDEMQHGRFCGYLQDTVLMDAWSVVKAKVELTLFVDSPTVYVQVDYKHILVAVHYSPTPSSV